MKGGKFFERFETNPASADNKSVVKSYGSDENQDDLAAYLQSLQPAAKAADTAFQRMFSTGPQKVVETYTQPMKTTTGSGDEAAHQTDSGVVVRL